MPIYEYVCKICGVFEVIQKITDKPIKNCPSCKKAVKKQLSNTGAPQFKGKGFYETDYKKRS
jgi:putative FmdB family regulatory protein